MSIEQMSNNMTQARFLALTPSYEEIYQVLSIKLQEEYAILAERIKNMPQCYGGDGDNSIDGPLLDADQVTWDRYTEISTIGRTLLEEQGWKPEDPVSKTLSGRVKLRILETLGHSPNDFDVY